MKAKIVFINLFLPITKKIFLLTGIFAMLNVMTLRAQVTIGENRCNFIGRYFHGRFVGGIR